MKMYAERMLHEAAERRPPVAATSGSHALQLYDDDAFLVDAIARFVESGLAAGEPTLIIATAPHRAELARRLESHRVDVKALTAGGRLGLFDAEDTLSRFMVNGAPDAARFERVIGELMVSCGVGEHTPRLRAYGEMVDLLWRRDQRQAALELEELWSRLTRTRPLSLLCAYLMGGFHRQADATHFHAVCGAHDDVIPTEGYSTLATSEDKLREIALLQQRARSLEAEIALREKLEEALREALRDKTRCEESLLRERAALEHSNRELDQFAYAVSHDLKAPLRAITNLSRWVEEDAANQLSVPSREHLALLRTRVQRQAALIDGILEHARLARVAGQAEEVDVGALVRDVLELLRPGATVEVVVSPRLPTLATERLPLHRVFQNLLDNALKYVERSDARIAIGVTEAPDAHVFSIADNGPGIAPEQHERIWTLLARAVTHARIEGSGIGLAMVKKIVETRGGRAWVESSSGEGATFFFSWPRPRP